MNYKNKFKIALWTGSVMLIITTGLIYMPMEKDRPGFWESLYSTLRLFVFERDLPTFPSAWQLIMIYFAAPLVTVSALGKLISYLFRISPSLRTRWMKGHVVVCGAGRLGMLIAGSLKQNGIPVVAVDSCWNEELEEWSHRSKVPALSGDFKLPSVLDKAGGGKARAILFTTGNDLLNIDAALNAYEIYKMDRGGVRLIWTHIADDWLAGTLRSAVETVGRLGIRFFDTYHIAAAGMVAMHITPEIREKIARIVIIGYGKFGSDIFEALAQEFSALSHVTFTIVDRRDIAQDVARHSGSLGISGRVTFEKTDLKQAVLSHDKPQAIFICTDNDLGNLSLALNLSSREKKGNIFVRMGHWPLQSVSEHLGKESGIVFVNINDHITQGLCKIGGLLTPATELDLKRVKKQGET